MISMEVHLMMYAYTKEMLENESSSRFIIMAEKNIFVAPLHATIWTSCISLFTRKTHLSSVCCAGSCAIKLSVQPDLPTLSQLPNSMEAYKLSINEKQIHIQARASHGLFNGVQTLQQLLPPTPRDSNQLECLQVSREARYPLYGRSCMHCPVQAAVESLTCKACCHWRSKCPQTWPVQVVDAPRFPWRGVLLDVGRHYFSLDFIKKLLDVMAFYKMNRFHWHLTEDQVKLQCLADLVPQSRMLYCHPQDKHRHSIHSSPSSSHLNCRKGALCWRRREEFLSIVL